MRKNYAILLAAGALLVTAAVCGPAGTPGITPIPFTPTPSPIPPTTLTPGPPTPTQDTGGTPGATPIGGEPTLPAVNLDCPKIYTRPYDGHAICAAYVIAQTEEQGENGPTGVTADVDEVYPIDLTLSSDNQCVIAPSGTLGYSKRWLNCQYLRYWAPEEFDAN